MAEDSQMARLSSEFDDFLFAPIGEDRHGMPLTMLSALARSELDPWDEAAQLSKVPEKYATARLAALIAALPGRPSITGGCAATAGQAVARLPRRTTATVQLPKAPPQFRLAQQSWAILCAVLMVLALGAQWIAVSDQAAAKGSAAVVPAPMRDSSGTPPLDTGDQSDFTVSGNTDSALSSRGPLRSSQ
jgi:hypothetical protein